MGEIWGVIVRRNSDLSNGQATAVLYHITGLVVNYGISNTIVLEIP